MRARGSSVYSASKAALIHSCAVAPMEAGLFGIRVNTVIPGDTESPIFKAHFARCSAEERAALGAANSPLGRFAEPEEMATSVLFLFFDDARFITSTENRV